MNTIQISRGDLALRLKDSAGYLKPGEYFIQTTTFNNKGTWAHSETGDKVTLVKDAITGFKYTPQEGDIFIGVPEKEPTGTYSLTRIGSSHSLINQYSIENGKFAVEKADSIINSKTVDKTAYEPNHLYMYSDSTPAKETGLRNIDGKPIELADTDVFIFLGEGEYVEGDKTIPSKYAIKMSGSNSVKYIKFPQVKDPENDSKSNQNHSFYSDSSLLDILYDIDRLKLSHYESAAVVMNSDKEFGTPNKPGVSHKLKAVYAGEKVKDADYRFVKKSELLKFFLGLYCENNGGTYSEADFRYQVARIQGTEWKFYKDPVDDESGLTRTGGKYTNTPIIVIDDKSLLETETFDSNFIAENFFKLKNPEDPNSPTLLDTDALGRYAIRDGLGKAVNVFFPNDEFVIKVKPGVLDDKVRPSENLHTLDKESADDEGTEVVQIELDLDDIEITRRGDGSNPNYDPTNGKDGKDLGPADPTDPHPRFGPRANDVATNYWQEEDGALKTNEDGIVSLFKSKADVDDEGHIFTSQLPRTVVGGMQRRGTISDLYSFLIFATDGLGTTLESPGANPPQEMLSIPASQHNYTSWEQLLDELGLDKLFEIDESGKIVKSKIDVGDYFIYSGPKLEVGTKEDDANWGKTSFREDYAKHHLNLEENPNATPWFYDTQSKKDVFGGFTLTDLLTYSNGGEVNIGNKLFLDPSYKGLLNGLKGVNYIKPGDIFVVEKITTGKTVAPVDEQSRDPHANPDTEDGFVLQMSLISSAADAVTGLIIENNNSETEKTEVTGAITLKPKKREDSVHDETTIESQGKNTIILGTQSVLWQKFKKDTDVIAEYNDVDPAIPLIDKQGFARHSNAKFMPDWSLNLGALKSEEFISPVVVEEGKFNPFASIRNAANLIKGDSNASSLSLKFATSTKSDKFTQVFQAENGVIALLSDIDDTPPEDVDSMKTQLHWHVRKEYVETGKDEDGNPIYKVQYHNSFLRDGGKKCDVDEHEFDDDGIDSNFVDNWNNGTYKKVGEEGFKQEECDRAFVFYNRDKKTVKTDGGPVTTQQKQTVKFVLASVENQDTTFESEPDNTKELESVQTLPRHSGVLLNSRSIIDCGEWL